MNIPAASKAAFLLVVVLARYSAAADKPWPYVRPAATERPSVKLSDWVRNDIDAFVLAGLEREGLQPAPEASRHTLLRRLYFDLIGLPPTPDEIDAFVHDTSADAYDNVVDQLLDDSRYGERWARFWLDLARYADTAGYEGDPDLPHAWRYRDYVIDAFNAGTPYDQFIREQIAGDEFKEIMGAGELPNVPAKNTVAMTFLRLAPFTEPRGDETRHEMLSEMTSTVASVFLGLTVGCAKCHDHKYDQIPTKDFYRMKAFFSTVSIPPPLPGDGYQIGGSLQAEFYRDGEKQWAEKKRGELLAGVEAAKAGLAELRKKLEEQVGSSGAGFGMQAMGGPIGNNYAFDKRSVTDGKLHLAIVNSDGQQWKIFTDGSAAGTLGTLAGSNQGDWFADLANPQYIALGQHTSGDGDPDGSHHEGHFAEVLIYDHPLDQAERDALDKYVVGKYHGAASEMTEPPAQGLRFWLDAADLDANSATSNPATGSPIEAWTDKVARLRLAQDDPSRQPKLESLAERRAAAVRFDDDFLQGPVASASFCGDQRGSLVVVFSATHQGEGYGLEVGGEGQFVTTVINPTAGNVPELAEAIRNPDLFTEEDRRRYDQLSTRDKFIEQHLKRLKPLAMSLRHSFGPPYEPGVPVSRVMIRGEYDNPGEVVEAGFPSCISGHQDPTPIRLDPFKRWPTRSRRMALADWIASPDNPLTARVMVNRLWSWHFGRGIVATPSDFGQLSGGPSHPELLDWLAIRFVDEKWSVKAMHRLIVTSSTYRQSSQIFDERAAEVDPDNKLLWRFRRRRLEAEAVRDAVLAVSGRLNPEQFGLPIFPPLPGDLAERVKYNESKWDTQYGPEGRKRSIYIYQQRTLTMPFLQVFDSLVCDESRPRRPSSVTPLQALAMYNGHLVNEEAGYFAERIRREAGENVDAQIKQAFLLAFNRPAKENEVRHMRQLLADSERPEDWLAGLCRVLLNANEFVYVD